MKSKVLSAKCNLFFIPGRSPTIFCAIMTQDKTYYSRAVYVNNTWARRCTKYIFVVSRPEVQMDLPLLQFDIPEAKSQLLRKSIKTFEYVYTHHINDADWFIKADDDTYIIMENLQDFLRDKNPADKVFYGQEVRSSNRSYSYTTGGAGYVLSKEALKTFGKQSRECERIGGREDSRLSNCLQNLGVKLINGVDSLGRNLFNHISPIHLLFYNLPPWYTNNSMERRTVSLL